MTLTELRYIVTLARERHFGRAAQKCHVSQPTLSVALKKVEQRHGVIIFERASGAVRLTPVGERLAAQAERVLDEASRLDEIVAAGANPLVGPFRLGVIYTIAPYLLPRLVPALHARAPRMPMYIQEDFTVSLSEKLRRGELDAIIVAEPYGEAGVVALAVYDEPFKVAIPADHPLASQDLIVPAQIESEHLLLLGQGNCFRDQVVQACPQLSKPGGIDGALEGSSLETVRYMVASGAGISVVPISAAKSWSHSEPLLQFRGFTEPVPFRRVVIAWRATYTRPKAIEVLRAALLAAPPAGVEPLR